MKELGHESVFPCLLVIIPFPFYVFLSIFWSLLPSFFIFPQYRCVSKVKTLDMEVFCYWKVRKNLTIKNIWAWLLFSVISRSLVTLTICSVVMAYTCFIVADLYFSRKLSITSTFSNSLWSCRYSFIITFTTPQAVSPFPLLMLYVFVCIPLNLPMVGFLSSLLCATCFLRKPHL